MVSVWSIFVSMTNSENLLFILPFSFPQNCRPACLLLHFQGNYFESISTFFTHAFVFVGLRCFIWIYWLLFKFKKSL